MKERNPYAISFGRIPNQYINRSLLVESILDTLNSDPVEEQAFKLTGIRGTGKTVTMTAIERELRNDDGWIVVDLKPSGEILADFVANLYSMVPFIQDYVDANLNLSAFGIGLSVTKKKPAPGLDVPLKKILAEIKKRKKKVLVAIDEIHKTKEVISFIQEFQILIREEMPVYLLVAGLYEDVESVENTEGLTFFLRAARLEMTPLNMTIIQEDYKKTLKLPRETAERLAVMTKGYAFAYQAFGKYMWDSHGKEISPTVLAEVDEALSQMVYDKIWSELAPTDKWFLRFIVQKDTMAASELLEMTKKKHNEWSVPRKRLIEKGIISGAGRGQIKVMLPRFKEYVERQEA